MARTKPQSFPETRTGALDPQMGPTETAQFSVVRNGAGLFQAQRVLGTQVTKISEPTVFEALAYRYLAGAVQDYWDLLCRERAH